jgi:hypothetical protein
MCLEFTETPCLGEDAREKITEGLPNPTKLDLVRSHVATLGHATKKLHIICLRVFSPPRWMAIFQVLKVVPPRKHQQSPRNFKRSQNEAKKKEKE